MTFWGPPKVEVLTPRTPPPPVSAPEIVVLGSNVRGILVSVSQTKTRYRAGASALGRLLEAYSMKTPPSDLPMDHMHVPSSLKQQASNNTGTCYQCHLLTWGKLPEGSIHNKKGAKVHTK